jgi:putative transposase
MTRRRHTPDQIIRKLAEGNKLLGGGTELTEVARLPTVAPRWGAAYIPAYRRDGAEWFLAR